MVVVTDGVVVRGATVDSSLAMVWYSTYTTSAVQEPCPFKSIQNINYKFSLARANEFLCQGFPVYWYSWHWLIPTPLVALYIYMILLLYIWTKKIKFLSFEFIHFCFTQGTLFFVSFTPSHCLYLNVNYIYNERLLYF